MQSQRFYVLLRHEYRQSKEKFGAAFPARPERTAHNNEIFAAASIHAGAVQGSDDKLKMHAPVWCVCIRNIKAGFSRFRIAGKNLAFFADFQSNKFLAKA